MSSTSPSGALGLFGRLRTGTALFSACVAGPFTHWQRTERLVHLTHRATEDISAAFRVSFGFTPGTWTVLVDVSRRCHDDASLCRLPSWKNAEAGCPAISAFGGPGGC
jgi:hypothetical protein